MANLVELFDNIVQMQNLNGVPLAAGKLYVYALGRTRLMDTWSDVDGESLNPNPIILDDAGQAHVYVSDDFDYTLVICDQYNNEIFSLDKYLYSKGSHSHADVAVAPSESIAVSSYHVGECTVYVPYLTGQLGKVYEGIDPIVVNNQVDKISANHVPLGVQDPLYFVQDDEEGCIIGLSGGAVPEGTMNESAFGYEDGKITGYNGSAFSAGNSYEAGSYVDITNNTINVTGLQPAGNYQSAGDYVVHDELSSYATQDWVENQSYMKEYMESAFYPSTSNPSGYLTAHQDISNKLDTTAFSTVSGDFLTAIPSEYVTENTLQSSLSSKLDSSAFSTVSGNFLTAHQSLDGLMSADLLEISDNKITGYNGTAFAGQGGGVTGDYELSAGSGISIVDYPLEQKTVISVTAQGGNPEVEQAVIDNSATWNTVSNKLDTTAFSDVSGTFLTAHQDLSDYQTIAGMTAYQEAGNYLSANALDNLSGNWENVTAKLDTTAFSDVSGTFLTAHQSLADYQTIAGMTAYANSAAVTGTAQYGLTTAGWSEITGGSVPTGVMTESGLEYDVSGNISAYSGSAFAAQLPEEEEVEFEEINISGISAASDYISANSANIDATVTNVSANSGVWGGSALPVSAGKGVKISLQNDTLVFENDVTVLWSGTGTSANISNITLSENITAFDKIGFYWEPFRLFGRDTSIDYAYTYTEVSTNPQNLFVLNQLCPQTNFNSTKPLQVTMKLKSSGTNLSATYGYFAANDTWYPNDHVEYTLLKIIGINRIAGGN